jgi:hypothetical protein
MEIPGAIVYGTEVRVEYEFEPSLA